MIGDGTANGCRPSGQSCASQPCYRGVQCTESQFGEAQSGRVPLDSPEMGVFVSTSTSVLKRHPVIRCRSVRTLLRASPAHPVLTDSRVQGSKEWDSRTPGETDRFAKTLMSADKIMEAVLKTLNASIRREVTAVGIVCLGT
jgi:hypothetical protein